MSLTDSITSFDTNGAKDVTILTSSLRRRDPVAAALRSKLRELQISSSLLVPESPVSAIAARWSRPWTTLEITRQEGIPGQTVRLPTRLASADEVWTAVDIDATAGRGPYVLDLLGRYTDLSTRWRMLGSRRRAELAVAVLRARPLHRHFIVKRFPAFDILATTHDPIAAELISLALVDEVLTRDHQTSGVWEDDFIQRASEQDLGARLPAEISVEVTGLRGERVDAIITRVLNRIGLELPRHD
jgi:hypothetical protein